MMNLYYVKSGAGLWGVPDDSVERFTPQRGEPLVATGKLERYDEKKHGSKAGSPPVEARKAQEREEREARARQSAAQK